MKIRYIVICIIAGITLSLVIACNRGTEKGGAGKLLGGDDQPIVVVGGSLDVSAKEGTWQGNPGNWQHKDKTGKPSDRYVTAIDIVYEDDQSFLPAHALQRFQNEQVTIEMQYKPKTASVVLKTDSNGQGLTLISDGKETPNTSYPKAVSMEPNNGKLEYIKITDAGKPYTCGAKGRCTLIIHYCDIAVGCR